MSTTSLVQRSATPVRVWLPFAGAPGFITLACFWASRVAVDDKTEGTYTALTLTFLVIACVVGPLVCLAWRCREMARVLEDELNDVTFRLERTEVDNRALSQVVEALSKHTLRCVPDHVPPEWS